MSLCRLYPHGTEFIFEKGQEIGFMCITAMYANINKNCLPLIAGLLKLNAPSYTLCSMIQRGDKLTRAMKIALLPSQTIFWVYVAQDKSYLT